MTTLEEFRRNLIYYRKQCHLTQDDLAKQLHVSRSAIAQWENGLVWPATPQLLRLCVTLQISCTQLLEESPPSSDSTE